MISYHLAPQYNGGGLYICTSGRGFAGLKHLKERWQHKLFPNILLTAMAVSSDSVFVVITTTISSSSSSSSSSALLT